jgi:hypothetical protein
VTPDGALARRFRLVADAHGSAMRRMNRRFGVTVVLVVLLVLGAYAAGMRDGRGVDALVVPIAVLVVLVVWSYRRRMSRFRTRWAAFEIVLGEDAIGREVPGLPSVRIPRGDVASIEELPLGLAVRDRAGRGLVVPRELDGYDEVRERLAAWRPIASPARRR